MRRTQSRRRSCSSTSRAANFSTTSISSWIYPNFPSQWKQFHLIRISFTVGNTVEFAAIMKVFAQIAMAAMLCSISWAGSRAQSTPQPPLDPTRNLPTPEPMYHEPLLEQYIWTANDVTCRRPDHSKYPWNRPDLRIEPHFFRAHFTIHDLPRVATFYVAGPREAHVYLNG